MSKNVINETRVTIFKSTISIITIFSYIAFSILKRFFENPKLFWIPLILLIANCFFIIEILYGWIIKKEEQTKGFLIWFLFQFVVSFGLILLIITYM